MKAWKEFLCMAAIVVATAAFGFAWNANAEISVLQAQKIEIAERLKSIESKLDDLSEKTNQILGRLGIK